MREQEKMQASLSAYPRVDTQRALAAACQGVNSILLCGKTSPERQYTIAKMLSDTIQNGKLLYVELALGKSEKGSVLPGEPCDQENLLQWLEKSVTSEDNIDSITVVVPLSDVIKEQAMLQELLFHAVNLYEKTIVAVAENGKGNRAFRFWLPVHADTLLLLPWEIPCGKMKKLMQEIYERDYTIAGVVEEKMFSDVRHLVRV